MNRKSLIISALLLGLAALLLQVVDLSPDKNGHPQVGRPLLPAPLAGQMDQLVLSQGGKHTRLYKDKGQWLVDELQGFPVNLSKLTQLISQLETSKVGFLVTDRPERLSELQMGLEGEIGEGVKLAFFREKQPLQTLIFGQSRQAANPDQKGAEGGYVRLRVEPQGFLIKEDLELDLDPRDWRLERVLALNADQIKSIRGLDWKLERAQSKDPFGPQTPEKNALNGLLRVLGDLSTGDQLTLDQRPNQAPKFLAKVEVETFNQEVLTLSFFEQPKQGETLEKYWLTLELNPKAQAAFPLLAIVARGWALELNDWQANRWVNAREQLFGIK
ncbi:MAG: hypothetical protein A2508_05800 [Candidatus Lambdaproteobacteria bacterium RIFOXYD12_FULL_49_8]|nr:MAG: hypothetical protein A2508_05800 [Candidatus Lambdaproteobacteria bacterium RIFOXYD12_FULL_49_8]